MKSFGKAERASSEAAEAGPAEHSEVPEGTPSAALSFNKKKRKGGPVTGSSRHNPLAARLRQCRPVPGISRGVLFWADKSAAANASSGHNDSMCVKRKRKVFICHPFNRRKWKSSQNCCWTSPDNRQKWHPTQERNYSM